MVHRVLCPGDTGAYSVLCLQHHMVVILFQLLKAVGMAEIFLMQHIYFGYEDRRGILRQGCADDLKYFPHVGGFHFL